MGVVFALLASATYAGILIAVRKTRPEIPMALSLVWMNWIPVLAFGAVVLFMPSEQTVLVNISMIPLLLLFMQSILVGVVGRILMFRSIHLIGASRAGQLFATQPLFTAMIAIVLLKEALTPGDIAGIVIVFCGIYYLYDRLEHPASRNNPKMDEGGLEDNGNEAGEKRTGRSFVMLIGLAVGLISAFCYSLGTVLIKMSYNYVSSVYIVILISSVVSLAVPGLMLGYETIRQRKMSFVHDPAYRSSKSWFYLAGLFLTVSMFFYYSSISLIPVHIVSTLQIITPLFVILFTRFFLFEQEKIGKETVFSALIIIAGLALVLLA